MSSAASDQRTVLVTGASGGLGQAIAQAFRAAGWFVIGVDRVGGSSRERVQRFVEADIATDEGFNELMAALVDTPTLDALVNNAAVQVNEPLIATSDEDWDRVMNVNVRAPFRMIRALHDRLARARGSIVNVSSVHAVATSPNVAAYAISKGALVALTRTAALELAADGIRCNAILPGAVMTGMLRDGLSRRPHPDGPDGNLAGLVDKTPLGFVAEPDQVAPSVVHLADSTLSPYTTGQTLVVDGGALLRLGTE